MDRVFGPVPSRRLGRSLGVNNIPPKVCTYSCIYCQLGRSPRMSIERRSFYPPEEIIKEARDRLEKARDAGENIDYITIVPDGEPTLDVNLGRLIDGLHTLLRDMGLETPIAVISNASLIWHAGVRDDLLKADLVSLKMDAVEEGVWKKIDRPHGRLSLEEIKEGMEEFSRRYRGRLITETMLVSGVNDSPEHMEMLAGFLGGIRPWAAYLSIPIRPPAEPWVQPPREERINTAYQILAERLPHVEYLIGYEGNAFSSTGDVREDILGITAVHPMREDALRHLLEDRGEEWNLVEALTAAGLLKRTEYRGETFYMRRIGG
ncbi:MAG: radical SAM protein, partial [Thermoplasmata archaeon]|nr:radical SAM protein [Thermoplasmata archaeon]